MIFVGIRKLLGKTTQIVNRRSVDTIFALRINGAPAGISNQDNFQIVMQFVVFEEQPGRKPTIGQKRWGTKRSDGHLFGSEARKEIIKGEYVLEAGPLKEEDCRRKVIEEYGQEQLVSNPLITAARQLLKDHPQLLEVYLKEVQPPKTTISALLANAQGNLFFLKEPNGILYLPVAELGKGDNKTHALEKLFQEVAGVSPVQITIPNKPCFLPDLGENFYLAKGGMAISVISCGYEWVGPDGLHEAKGRMNPETRDRLGAYNFG